MRSVRRHALSLAIGALILVAGAAAMPGVAAARSSPRLLYYSYSDNLFGVRPAYMSFLSPVVQMPTAYITGPKITRRQWRKDHLGHIVWTRWSQRGVKGYGEQWEDDCSPSCARGLFVPEQVTVYAWRVRRGRYTRLKLAYAPPGLRPYSFTYELLNTKRSHSGGFWYWGTRTTVAD